MERFTQSSGIYHPTQDTSEAATDGKRLTSWPGSPAASPKRQKTAPPAEIVRTGARARARARAEAQRQLLVDYRGIYISNVNKI